MKPEADVEGQKELRIYSECGMEPENFNGRSGGDMATPGAVTLSAVRTNEAVPIGGSLSGRTNNGLEASKGPMWRMHACSGVSDSATP